MEQVTGVVYYTPLGVELIEKYVKDNFNPTEQMYVRGAKKDSLTSHSSLFVKVNISLMKKHKKDTSNNIDYSLPLV